MDDRLNEHAQETYFDLVRLAWKAKIISSSELNKRLRVLDDMKAPSGSWTYNPVWLRRPRAVYEETFNGESDAFCFPISTPPDLAGITDLNTVTSQDPSFVVQLIRNAWKFNKGDADPHPSVPHGHGVSDQRIKLDAYLGHTFHGTRLIGRLPKKEIIEMWNDKGFRGFACEVLDHFMRVNPNYKFRVNRPRRLPKRR